jgi:hypothetical protein
VNKIFSKGFLRKIKRSQGILLLEALISIVVLSVGITAAIRSLAYASNIHDLTKNYLMGLRLLEEKIAEMDALPELEEGETSGVFEILQGLFTWTAKVTALEQTITEEPEEEPVEIEPSTHYLSVSIQVKWEMGEGRAVWADTILLKKKKKEEPR